VVVSDVPGLNATVHAERDALLFKAGDPLALADQVARIAADIALRTRLVEAGRANAAAYTMASFAAGLEQVYREALASPMGTT
jgi:glycosyltransferase involved in cell wall biosynthesis